MDRLAETTSDNDDTLFARCAEVIRTADFLVISAGAGMGVDAGFAVYKDVDQVDIYKDLKVSYADLATEEMVNLLYNPV